jgi:hypothetical protein
MEIPSPMVQKRIKAKEIDEEGKDCMNLVH